MADHTWRAVSARITSVVETEPVLPPASHLPTATVSATRSTDWLLPDFCTYDGGLRGGFQALLVEIDGGRCVVGTCIGADKERRHPVFRQLQSALERISLGTGRTFNTVDGVIRTDCHHDHVDWNVVLRDSEWRRTHPPCYISADELAFWADRIAAPRLEGDGRDQDRAVRLASIQPISITGLLAGVAPEANTTAAIRLAPPPGPVASQVSVVLECEGERAIIPRNITHHPCQMAHPPGHRAGIRTARTPSRLGGAAGRHRRHADPTHGTAFRSVHRGGGWRATARAIAQRSHERPPQAIAAPLFLLFAGT
jgi:hypothetical protein